MIKVLGIILVVGGIVGLVMGVLGIFGSLSFGMSPWAFAILGFIFLLAGTGMLKRRKDTDEVD
mgnify:CR=1 FL=1